MRRKPKVPKVPTDYYDRRTLHPTHRERYEHIQNWLRLQQPAPPEKGDADE